MSWRLATITAIVGLVAGCGQATPSVSPPTAGINATGTPAATAVPPSFAPADCPEEVTVVMVVVPTCGYLSVPERRDHLAGPAVRIFVARIEPPEGIAATDAMVVVGEALGGELEYGGLGPMAQRTGRPIYLVDRRGTGLSEPSLACPEVAAAAPASRALASKDGRSMEPILTALRACRERLTGAGIDLTAYDLDASARDIEDLRVALGLEPWNVIAFGSASRLALEVGRLAPDGVRTLVLDSPVLPQGPDPMFDAGAARSAIDELAAICVADPSCPRAFPDVAQTLDAAVRRLDLTPVIATVDPTGAVGSETIVVDGTRLGRAVRAMLADAGGSQIEQILTSVASVADGDLAPGDPILQRLARDDGLCLGYVPDCSRIVHGSLLTTVCREVLPFIDQDLARSLGADVPGMGGVFASNPYFAACETWDIPPADGAAVAPIRSTIPTFVMNGKFDPFTGPSAEVQSAADGLTRATFVEVPNQSYNVFGFNECPRRVRRAWLDDPTAALDTTCFEEIPAVRPVTETINP